jgi:Ca-activated chloride channel family protein
MTFRDPRLLWLLAALPFATVWLVARERSRERLARLFVAERLRGVSNPVRVLRPWLTALGLAAAIVALAGPQFGFTMQRIEAREANRVILLDVSLSMNAEDVGTSRLDAAKAVAKRIIAAHPGRIGLVIFENDAEVVSPLTSDGDAVAALVDSIEAGEIGDPGSNVGKALLTALKLSDVDPTQKADFVLISDGEDQGHRLGDAIARVKARGVSVSTVLIGTPNGATIPAGEQRVLTDDAGEVVHTAARPDVLQSIAQATGGTLFVNPFGEHALDALAASGGTHVEEKEVRVPIDRYQWPLALAFGCLMLGSFVNRGAE